MTTREEHLRWCKDRALQLVESGDATAAVASMISDLGNWQGGALYDRSVFNALAMDGLMFRKTADQVRNWIEGFN
jgi:hypothetical protein